MIYFNVHLSNLDKTKPVIWTGDLNVAQNHRILKQVYRLERLTVDQVDSDNLCKSNTAPLYLYFYSILNIAINSVCKQASSCNSSSKLTRGKTRILKL